MTTLTQEERDLDLPRELGERELALPEPTGLCERVRAHLLPSGGPAVLDARLLFARWKPGTAIAGTWSVVLEGLGERLVSYKAYGGEKHRDASAALAPNRHMLERAAPLAPFAHLVDERALLGVWPADRVLRGAARLHDLRRTARLLDEDGPWPGRVLRRRSSNLEVLRYKPERRAVLRLDAKLKQRHEGGTRHAGEARLGVRVLPPREAALVAHHRELARCELLPRLWRAELETGLLFEEWIEGAPLSPNDFEHAALAAETVAALHATPARGEARPASRAAALELLGRVEGLARRVASLPAAPVPAPRAWIHGDFHPDQLTRTEGGARLLDADALRPGAPEEDLASWCADVLEARPEASFEETLEDLLAGYPADLALDRGLIRALTAEALVQRAAGGLRRLQCAAPERALRLVRRAEELLA